MSLLTTLQSAASSLSVFESAMNTVQNNVTNASVPNYTSQTPSLASTWTGVAIKGTLDARNSYAEHAVWDANTNLGQASALADNLSIIQSQFDVSGSTGVPGALSKAFTAFSAWATSPTDSTARNQVLVAAHQVADAFNQASQSMQQSRQQVDRQLSDAVSQINSIASKIVDVNVQIQNDGGTNPSLQAQLYAELQHLSQFTTISVHIEANGTATVLMDGEVPLAVGRTASPITLNWVNAPTPANPSAPPSAQITALSGTDFTLAASQGGQLAGLLQLRNSTIPEMLGDQMQQGSLNTLAQAFADRVNTILSSGQAAAGPPPIPGKPVFTYTPGSPTAVAASLAVDPTLQGTDLAAIAPGGAANGIANQLAGLSNSSNPADQVNGATYTGFYSKIAADLGSQASAASAKKSSQTDQVTQAENLRSDISGISLNEQAALLMQYQQAYQASTQLVQVINGLTSDLMNMMQGRS